MKEDSPEHLETLGVMDYLEFLDKKVIAETKDYLELREPLVYPDIKEHPERRGTLACPESLAFLDYLDHLE